MGDPHRQGIVPDFKFMCWTLLYYTLDVVSLFIPSFSSYLSKASCEQELAIGAKDIANRVDTNLPPSHSFSERRRKSSGGQDHGGKQSREETRGWLGGPGVQDSGSAQPWFHHGL